MSEATTPHKAKKLLAAELTAKGLPFTKLTARHYASLDNALFVTIHGWEPNPAFDDLRRFAKQHGFIVQADKSIYPAPSYVA
jgi:hypothetical protein